jgi:hypothetical protein
MVMCGQCPYTLFQGLRTVGCTILCLFQVDKGELVCKSCHEVFFPRMLNHYVQYQLRCLAHLSLL